MILSNIWLHSVHIHNCFFFFFFNDPAPPEISPFPLPTPFPIGRSSRQDEPLPLAAGPAHPPGAVPALVGARRGGRAGQPAVPRRRRARRPPVPPPRQRRLRRR